jgi:hypothetical protein
MTYLLVMVPGTVPDISTTNRPGWIDTLDEEDPSRRR